MSNASVKKITVVKRVFIDIVGRIDDWNVLYNPFSFVSLFS